jgi:26S proteasome regulatory subunit N1
LINSTVHDENDPALALLTDKLEADAPIETAMAIMGLGIAYTGSNRDDLKDLLLPIAADVLADDKLFDLQLASMAALALGQVYIGQGASEDNEIASTMLQTLMEMQPDQLKSPWIKFYCLGLALLFFGKQDASDAIVETLKAIDHPIAEEAIVMLSLSSFAGTGEVLRIQQMLRLCAEKLEGEKDPKEKDAKEKEKEKEDKKDKKKKDDKKEDKGEFKQGLAVLAIAAIAMGEDVGKELCMRHFGHLVIP